MKAPCWRVLGSLCELGKGDTWLVRHVYSRLENHYYWIYCIHVCGTVVREISLASLCSRLFRILTIIYPSERAVIYFVGHRAKQTFHGR